MKLSHLSALFLIGLAALTGCQKTDTIPSPAPALEIDPTHGHLLHVQPKLPTIKVWLGDQELIAEIASKSVEIATGMMFRTNMPENEAMIFVFPDAASRSFYMRNCFVPLSGGYINPQGELLQIIDMKPHDETGIPSDSNNIQFVLEVPQGWFKRHNIPVGTMVRTERGSLQETFSASGAEFMKVALAQINPIVGDLAGNEAKIVAAYRRGSEAGADIVVCPELCVTGYPPRDLLLRKRFVAENLAVLGRLAAATGKTGLLAGFVGENKIRPGREVTNSVALLQHGKIAATRAKTLLPSYDVFDEDRYFEPAAENHAVEFDGLKAALTICEDIWNDEDFWPVRRYQHNPPVELAEAGAHIIFNISASPWHLGKNHTRLEMLRSLALKTGRPVVFCNQVGGNDELIFDGSSLVFNANGELIARGKLFEEDFVVVDVEPAGKSQISNLKSQIQLPGDEELLFKALVLGVRDYLHKCGFQSAVLGLSGGIDSAVTAVLAVAALGRENVRGLSLPSEFSSQHSLDDARVLAERLGIQYDVVPIQPAFATVRGQLQPVFAGRAEDTTEENIQARLRGVILMALSNKFGSLLLTTGNKSELAVGYCTLYGDMCGGLAVISDVPKTMIYRLARWINRAQEIIPSSSITKPPSAELRPNQTDQDSLPPYEVLDAILDLYVVQGKAAADIIAAGFDEANVRRVVRLIDLSEYKRRQAAPGLKVTTKAFGVGRRIPIAQKYRE